MSAHGEYMVMDLLIFWDSGAPAGLELPVSRLVSDLLGIPARVCQNPVVLNGYVGSRRQTDARVLLDSIDTCRQRQGLENPVILVTGNDIFMDGVVSLFGLARPSACAAVVSTRRLTNEFYGRDGDEDELVDRLVKESAHEVGHLIGLDHCTTPECIMYNPLTLDDLDRKKRWFCPDCQEKRERARITD
jgi:archaemetzincin